MNAKKALRAIAKRDGISVKEVEKQINLAIQAGLSNPAPAVQAEWRKIPCKGAYPTAEELITYQAKQIKNQQ